MSKPISLVQPLLSTRAFAIQRQQWTLQRDQYLSFFGSGSPSWFLFRFVTKMFSTPHRLCNYRYDWYLSLISSTSSSCWLSFSGSSISWASGSFVTLYLVFLTNCRSQVVRSTPPPNRFSLNQWSSQASTSCARMPTLPLSRVSTLILY